MRIVSVALAAVIAASCALSVALYKVFATYARTQVENASYSSLTQAAKSLSAIWNLLYWQMERANNANSSISMGMESPSLTPFEYSKVFGALGSLVDANNAMDSAYVYNSRMHVFFSSIGVMSPQDSFYDEDILSILEKTAAEKGLRTGYRVEYRPLSYSYAATSYSLNAITLIFRSKFSDSALIFNIDQNALQDILATDHKGPELRSMIINSDGTIISDTLSSHIFDNCSEDEFFKAFSGKSGSGVAYGRADGRPMLVSWFHYNRFSELNWYIIHMRDEEQINMDARRVALFLLAGMICFTLLAILLFMLFTRRLSISVGKLLRLAAAESKFPQVADDEFSFLEGSISHMSSSAAKLNRTLDLLSLRNAFFLRLIYIGPGVDFEDQCEALGFSPNQNRRILIFHAPSFFTLGGEGVKALRKDLTEIFSDYGDADVIEDSSKDRFGCVLPESAPAAEILEQAGKLLSLWSESGKGSISAGVGSLHPIRALGICYRTACEAEEYSFAFGRSRALSYEEIINSFKSQREYPKEEEQAVLAGMKTGDDVRGMLSLFLEKIRGYPLQEIFAHIRCLAGAVLTAIPDESGGHAEDYMDHIRRMRHIQEFEVWLASIIEQRQEVQKLRRSVRIDALVMEVMAYVAENYASPGLSVEEISEKVSLSPNYVRTLFKEKHGTSLSKYISDFRFEQASRLLSSTDLPANKIGESVGFTNSSYFYTAFRKSVGMTPEEFRRKSKAR
ncbi:MAG: helix-turn-helix domain-containing protein [Clostridiales bacterium]|nr:helix-turn-helix domain-containing protein [Clostridiales bacterium]